MLREQVPDLHPGGLSRGAAALRWRRVALSPLSWVLLNEEVWFHQSKATAVWIRDPAADSRGGVSV